MGKFPNHRKDSAARTVLEATHRNQSDISPNAIQTVAKFSIRMFRVFAARQLISSIRFRHSPHSEQWPSFVVQIGQEKTLFPENKFNISSNFLRNAGQEPTCQHTQFIFFDIFAAMSEHLRRIPNVQNTPLVDRKWMMFEWFIFALEHFARTRKIINRPLNKYFR